MRLDVIIPTYNRQPMLERTLRSLLAATVPSGMEAQVTVVDNNSKDRTRQFVESQMELFGGRLRYVFEHKQGRSHALNAGIAATDGDLVGMIDDDEEIETGWYVRIHRAFLENGIDFIGGPYVPRWGAECPVWFPASYKGVVGWVDSGDEVRSFDENFEGMLMGGNAVLRRSILARVGPYSTSLGRTDKHLLSCEDDDMYQRLRAAGARGLYLPDLIIYHYIPPERLTKRYFRRWCFWHGVSQGMLDRERRSAVAYFGGVPRWLYGRAARGALATAKELPKRNKDAARIFANELALWDLAGFFYGKHLYRPQRGRTETREICEGAEV